jgi:hypothetical protein
VAKDSTADDLPLDNVEVVVLDPAQVGATESVGVGRRPGYAVIPPSIHR